MGGGGTGPVKNQGSDSYGLCCVTARSGMSRPPLFLPSPPPPRRGRGEGGPYLARKLDHYEMVDGCLKKVDYFKRSSLIKDG
jgi:hypothetical protein